MHRRPIQTADTPAAAAAFDHDLGLRHDLAALARQMRRRRALQWLGAGTSLVLGSSLRAEAADSGSCSLIPQETAGPFPGNGANRVRGEPANVLVLSGIVRSDIRSSIGGTTGTAPGVPLRMRLQLVNTQGGCAPLAGLAIYLWHCTRDGLYSMYSPGVAQQNFLRGVQVTGADGVVTFQTIFPGCYAGRMPHMHLEVYRSAAAANSFSNVLRTSQIAFAPADCQRIYAAGEGYQQSLSELSQTSLDRDFVFRDGHAAQLAAVNGSASGGLSASLRIGIAA